MILTGPARVLLGRAAVELLLPLERCGVEDLLDALAHAEPRIAPYLRGDDGRLAPSLRPLLDDRLLEAGEPIPDGGTVTLLYAVAGGQPGPE